VDEDKIRAIRDWAVPIGLASFYIRFVRNFNSLVSPVTEVLKGKKFEWNDQAKKAFESIKEKLINALIRTIPNFAQVFKVECDAFGMGIGAVLT